MFSELVDLVMVIFSESELFIWPLLTFKKSGVMLLAALLRYNNQSRELMFRDAVRIE